MRVICQNESELRSVAEALLREVIMPKAGGVCVIGLEGDLGAGKTSFTKHLCELLSIQEIVTSPTFVIQKSYDISALDGFKKLVHIDVYRLDRGEELLTIGWNELLKESGVIVCVEWPKHVESVLPTDTHRVQFTYVNETTREISW